MTGSFFLVMGLFVCYLTFLSFLISPFFPSCIKSEESTQRQVENESEHHPINLRKARTNGRPKPGPKPEPTFRALGVRGKGQKKLRRYDNGNIRQSLEFSQFHKS